MFISISVYIVHLYDCLFSGYLGGYGTPVSSISVYATKPFEEMLNYSVRHIYLAKNLSLMVEFIFRQRYKLGVCSALWALVKLLMPHIPPYSNISFHPQPGLVIYISFRNSKFRYKPHFVLEYL